MNIHHPTGGKPNGAQPARSVHPGSGRRRTREFPKGRQVDPQAQEEIRALLGSRPRQRDLLIEHLHLVQDRYGCLHARHLAALAAEMRLAMAEVYEVASFYAHFDIVMEGEEPPPPLTVRVCESLTCAMMGAEQLLDALPSRLGAGVRVVRAPCMGGCHNAPVAAIGHALHERATVDSIAGAVSRGDTHPHVPIYVAFDAYRAGGGYRLLEACLDGTRAVDDVIRTMEMSRSGTIKLLRYEAHLTGGSIAMDELERLLWQRKREYVPPPLNINLGWRTGDRMVVDGPNENVPGLN